MELTVSSFLLVFAILFQIAMCEPTHSFGKRRPLPPLPNNDEWYGAPDNLAGLAPGDIIKWRQAPAPISMDNVSGYNLAGVWQIQYRTQNSVGAPIANVVTVMIPHNANPNALFAYAYFSDSAAPRCNPSIAMMTGTTADAIFTKQQLAAIVPALNAGWIVSVADDGGPEASFPAGLTMAYTTLDSIRAMKKTTPLTGLSADATVTLNGYSGGAVTAGWAGEIHPLYAPELKIDGIALGGLIPDFVALANYIKNGTGYFAWGPEVYAGLSHDYRDLSDWLDQNVDPAQADAFWATETYCIDQNAATYTNISTCSYFSRGCDALNDDLPNQILLDAAVMGRRATPKAPWYLYETKSDQISPVQLTTDLYQKYCDQGASILYELSDYRLTHSLEAFSGYPGAFQWMKERHAGTPLPYQGCQITSYSSYTRASLWPIPIFSIYMQTMLASMGAPLGPAT